MPTEASVQVVRPSALRIGVTSVVGPPGVSGFITLADGAPVPVGTPSGVVIVRYTTV